MTECLGCNLIEETGKTATLLDGRTVCTSCDDFRHEAECRNLLGKKPVELAAYLEDIRNIRGEPSAQAIRETMKLLRGKKLTHFSRPRTTE